MVVASARSQWNRHGLRRPEASGWDDTAAAAERDTASTFAANGLRSGIAKFFDDFVNVPRKAHRLSGSVCALLALLRSVPASVVSL